MSVVNTCTSFVHFQNVTLGEVQGDPVDVQDNKGWIPVHDAAAHGNNGCLDFLLRQDVNVECKTLLRGETPLLLAARGGNFECCRTLIRYSANVNTTTKENFVPLWEAVNVNSLECVILLLENGAHINHQIFPGYSVLHTSAMNGHADILIYLVGYGAQLDICTGQELTPIFLASLFGHKDCLSVLLEMVKDKGIPMSKISTYIWQSEHKEIISTTENNELAPMTKTENNDLAPMTKTKNNDLAPMTKTKNNDLAPITKTKNNDLAPITKTKNNDLAPISKTKNNDLAPMTKTESRLSFEVIKTMKTSTDFQDLETSPLDSELCGKAMCATQNVELAQNYNSKTFVSFEVTKTSTDFQDLETIPLVSGPCEEVVSTIGNNEQAPISKSESLLSFEVTKTSTDFLNFEDRLSDLESCEEVISAIVNNEIAPISKPESLLSFEVTKTSTDCLHFEDRLSEIDSCEGVICAPRNNKGVPISKSESLWWFEVTKTSTDFQELETRRLDSGKRKKQNLSHIQQIRTQINKQFNNVEKEMMKDPARTIINVKLDLQKIIKTGGNNIRGCCISAYCDLFFTDHKMLKVVPSKGRLSYNMMFGHSSWFGVIFIHDKTVAITSGGSLKKTGIHIIDVENQKKIKFINLHNRPWGIARDHDSMFVCVEGRGVIKLNIDDNIPSRVISYDLPMNSSISVFADKIYFTNRDMHSVICCDYNGSHIWTFKDDSVLQCLSGVSLDNEGNVFVVGEASANVVFITNDGKHYKEILTKEDGLCQPSAIYFDKQTNKLLISNKEAKALLYNFKSDA